MNLIDVLAAGVVGAENGTATLLKRGTGATATYFQDFEGTDAVSTGTPITLDSNGRTVAYVNELVEVEVKDSDGITVLTFTAGAASGVIEYQGQSFTGTSYSTAASAAGNPTNLQALLDLWLTNAGAIDWKVLVSGSAATLSNALGAVTGMLFNVKDPAYGAVGDNVSNDAAAIGAAITAAATNGGIVFFPPGTYRCTTSLTLSPKVSMLGCGPNASIITMDHATNDFLIVTGSPTVNYQTVEGLKFVVSQANSGKLVTVGTSTLLAMRNCYVGGANVNGYVVYGVAMGGSSAFVAKDCTFAPAGASKTALLMNTGVVTLNNCVCKTPASYTPAVGSYGTVGGFIFATSFTITNCTFDNTASAAGTYVCVHANNSSVAGIISDCTFLSGTGATVTYIALGTYSSAAMFKESNNIFGTDTAYSYTVAVAASGAQVALNTRERRVKHVTASVSPANLPTDQYGMIHLESTVAGNVTMTPALCPEGATGRVAILNSAAAPHNFSQGTPFANFGSSATKTVANGTFQAFEYWSVTVPAPWSAVELMAEWLGDL